MNVNDPIADLLTRVRNAIKAKKKFVEIPSSKMKVGVADIMKRTGFINDYQVTEDNKQGVLKIALKYTYGIPAISGLKRISSPGLRIYSQSSEAPRVLNGLGMSVLSTSKGLMSDKQAKRENVGGEVICYIW